MKLHDDYGLTGTALALMFLAGIGLLFGSIVLFNYRHCQRVDSLLNVETDFAFVGGCYVHDSEGWVPLDRWQVNDLRSGIGGAA